MKKFRIKFISWRLFRVKTEKKKKKNKKIAWAFSFSINVSTQAELNQHKKTLKST
jgi:predicted 3-demethylubiquinone-9 3-methyltransferase (glyoxalase superfamily)